MTEKAANKHEIRTRETRAALLAAAETIFVRDGYEGAELGEIAALAGRTKGAIYAQFKSKEDIFLALIEHRRQCSRAQMEKLLARSTTTEGNLEALRTFFQLYADDQAWSILLLEFKLFALRHPESKKRLQSLYAEMLSPQDEARLVRILGPVGRRKDAISRVVAVQAIQPFISGIVLESQVGTHPFDKATIRKLTNRIFDALMDAKEI